MATGDTKSPEELRQATDQHLQHERGKTDEYLDQRHRTVEEATDDTIQENRDAADTLRESARADEDHEKTERQPGTTTEVSRVDQERVSQERERYDHARTVEREIDDRAWARERLERRLLADALLDRGREETDRSLVEERLRVDVESDHQAHRLSDEQVSHELTKAALAMREHFVSVISHDLKNPLVAISIGARLLRQGIPKALLETGSLVAYLRLIEQSVAVMDRIISDLLDMEHMARREDLVLTPTRVDLWALASECRDLLAPIAASKALSLTLAPCPRPIFADVDHDRILQVLSNIIGNSLKFTPPGGSIELLVQTQGTTAVISVTDNGPGIPREKQDHIFERYGHLTSKDRPGLGMGLFISKWIVEAHGGGIWVTSDGVHGSTFGFTLPLPVSK